jgi:predicted dehydrogenase
MEVYGATGSAITVKRDEVRVRRAGEDQDKLIAAKEIPAPYDDSMTYLRAVILDGASVEPLSSLETNVIVTEILDAARRSAKEGRTVRLAARR